MTQIKNWVAIVPARKGSKRLPNKNLLKLGNQSLVEIAVQKALDTNIFEKVIISSDSQEIVDLAKRKGAMAFGLRKPNLSNDLSKTEDVILDLLNQKELSGIDGFTLIQCTSPFTKLETIKNITLEAFKNKCSSISIRELKHTYLEWLLIKKGRYLTPIAHNSDEPNVRSQDATKVLCPTGNAYAVNKEYFLKYNSLLGPYSEPYLINSNYELIDIDERKDFENAEKIFKKYHLVQK